MTFEQFKKLSIDTIDDLSYDIMIGRTIIPIQDKTGKENIYWNQFIVNMLFNKDIDGHLYNNILIESSIFGLKGVPWAKTIGDWKLDFDKMKEIF